MRTSVIAVVAVLGLAGWHAQGVAHAGRGGAAQTAYADAVQRYQGGLAVQHAAAPQRAQPLADAANATGAGSARYAEGAGGARYAEGANASGVDNGRLT